MSRIVWSECGGVVASLVLAACGGGSSSPTREPCGTGPACASGDVCMSGNCVKLCDDDSSACPDGTTCNGTFCVSAVAPQMTAVYGEGSVACTGAAAGRCFSDHLVVEGQGLKSATFELRGSQNFALTPADATTDSRAVVMLPVTLVAGTYDLVAVNAAGQTKQAVMILQGEPGQDGADGADGEKGDKGDTGNPGPALTGTELVAKMNEAGTTGRFVVARLPAANDLVTHLNTGDGSVKLSASILPTASGGIPTGNEIIGAINNGATTSTIAASRVEALTAASIVGTINAGSSTINNGKVQPPTGATIISQINAATSGTIDEDRLPGKLYVQRTVASPGDQPADIIDDTKLLDLCGDADGCTISIGMRQFELWPNLRVPATTFGPPCRFHIDRTTRWWALGRGCDVTLYGTDYLGHDNSNDETTPHTPYNYWVLVTTVPINATDNAHPCRFTEGLGSGTTGTDPDAGFHFSLSSEAPPAFDATDRTCELVIED